jgi:branched-chain amino acid transport system permease protein
VDLSFFINQALTGLASASSLFLVASGLTLIFGVSRIVNFAHGSLFMLGAYVAVTVYAPIVSALGPTAGPWIAMLVAALTVGLIGAVIEVLLLRRLYHAPHMLQILATFGIVLIVQDAVVLIWGHDQIVGPRIPDLRGAVTLFGQRFPQYELFMLFIGPAIFIGLWLLLHRTRWGILVRAATRDREMADVLGVDQAKLFTGVFFLGAALAGLAGGLQLPREPANIYLDTRVILEAFVVTVIGGLGSIGGALLASIIIGLLQAFSILIFPKSTLVLVFAVMAVVLMIRPWGLLGRPEPQGVSDLAETKASSPARPYMAHAIAIALAILLVLPLFATGYMVKLATQAIIFALVAFSLNFIVATGGILSFGHAAFFGLGAYVTAIAVKAYGVPAGAAMIAAPVVAGLVALAVGWFIVRRTGIYLAMLTLAFAQIVWSAAFQWVEFTGGDNGIVGVWMPGWASETNAYYYLTFAVCGSAIALIWRITFAPFGYALRASRDSALRCDAIGIDVRMHQVLAFAIAGTAAGMAGSSFMFLKGGVDPSLLSMDISADALIMSLLGGVQTIVGPLVGGVVFTFLKATIMPLTDQWRLVLGIIIVVLVLAFPRGIVGFIASRSERLDRLRTEAPLARADEEPA